MAQDEFTHRLRTLVETYLREQPDWIALVKMDLETVLADVCATSFARAPTVADIERLIALELDELDTNIRDAIRRGVSLIPDA